MQTFKQYLIEQANLPEELEKAEAKKKKNEKSKVYGWANEPAGLLKYLQRANAASD